MHKVLGYREDLELCIVPKDNNPLRDGGQRIKSTYHVSIHV